MSTGISGPLAAARRLRRLRTLTRPTATSRVPALALQRHCSLGDVAPAPHTADRLGHCRPRLHSRLTAANLGRYLAVAPAVNVCGAFLVAGVEAALHRRRVPLLRIQQGMTAVAAVVTLALVLQQRRENRALQGTYSNEYR